MHFSRSKVKFRTCTAGISARGATISPQLNHKSINSSERPQDEGHKVKGKKVQTKGHKGEATGHKVKMLISPGALKKND